MLEDCRIEAPISVVMATYNGANYIKEQMDSILRQTIKPQEIIVVDDCSTDETLEILKKYEQKIDYIHVYSNKYNLGFQKNFNKAICLSKCNFIALCDQDDIWTKEHLQVLYDLLIEEKKDLACGASIKCDIKGNIISKPLYSNFKICNNQSNQFKSIILSNYVQGCTSMFRRSLIDLAEPFPNSKNVFHDYWLGLAAVINTGISFTNRPIVYYRVHNGSITNNQSPHFFDRLKRKFSNFLIPNHIESLNKTYETLCYAKKKYNLNIENTKALDDAIKFFDGVINNKNWTFCARFYIKNMHMITKNTSTFSAILTGIKWLFFCWKGQKINNRRMEGRK